SAQFTRVTFEYSTDNVNYTLLGNGTATGSNWTLTGLNLPTGQKIYIRARGYYRSGYQNGSESLTESLRNAFALHQALLGNISTRAFVQTGDNVMIGGLIITGPDSDRVIVRAIGPSLAQYGITNPLADPTLELHNGNGAVIAFNDNWKDSQQAEIEATGLAPSNDAESAIVQTLAPGNYTAIVRGVNNTIGVALAEVYGLN